ncbi:MAG: cysteine desulfurase family protein [Acidimicrobiales bacterium]
MSDAAPAGPPLTYLDHASTSPLRPEVLEAMAPFFGARFANPSGAHRAARDARAALEEAREQVASVLGAHPSEVVFTSGGTEADNLAILGPLAAVADDRTTTSVVCSAVEHAAVLAPARAAVRRAARGAVSLELAPVDGSGAVEVAGLEELLTADTAVVSVMLANNEVGTVQPIGAVVEAVRRRAPQAVVHTDAVQAAAWLDVAELASRCDLVSVSAHKLGGPKGAGALVVRGGTRVEPIIHGGGQEQERRSGTHDVAGAVGLATALAAAASDRATEGARVRALRDRLADGLLAAVPSATESAARCGVLPGHCHLCIGGIEREELLVLLDDAGVCASAGSACASGALEPSHVLAAMGVGPSEARGALRLTLGRTTSDADVDRALSVVPRAVARLRDGAPPGR